MTATVGGVGTRCWRGPSLVVFNNSDYHVIEHRYKDSPVHHRLGYADFWPGQYAKTYT